MTDREIMQQALEALDLLSRVPKAKRDYADRAIAALRERLAQPEPIIDKSAAIRIATALGWEPRREWVGLTDEDKQTAVWTNGTFGAGALWAEAKLREKNT